MFDSLIRGPDDNQNLRQVTKYSTSNAYIRRVHNSKIGRTTVPMPS